VRAAAGFVAIHAAFVGVGMALLFALGMVSRVRDVPARIGPAYLSGVASVIPCLVLLLVAGVPVRLPALALTSALLAGGFAAIGVWLARRGRPAVVVAPSPAGRIETLISRVAVAVLGLYFAIGASAYAHLSTFGDDWAFWSFKGRALYDFGGRLKPEVFLNVPGHPPHLDYPLLHPLLESLTFRAMGGVHLQEWHISLWILLAAFVWTVGFLLRSRGVSMPIVLAPLAALAVSPYAQQIVWVGYADVTVACFVGTGALAIGLWLDGGRVEYAVLGAVLLAGAANTKNEGETAAIAVLVAAAVVLRVARERRWSQWLGAAAIAAAGAAPWIVWRSAHGLRNDDLPSLGTSLDLGYLTGRLDRLGSAIDSLAGQLAMTGKWLGVFPCFLILAIACFVRSTARRQAAFYLGTLGLMLLILLWIYWTGLPPLATWLSSQAFHSVNRVVTMIVFTAGAGSIHLAARLLGSGSGMSQAAARNGSGAGRLSPANSGGAIRR
jgi:hypothetical protein